jgi:hypothetical protein
MGVDLKKDTEEEKKAVKDFMGKSKWTRFLLNEFLSFLEYRRNSSTFKEKYHE